MDAIPARNGRAIEVWLIAAFAACPGAALPELAEVGQTTTGMIRQIARLLVQRGALRKLGDSYEPAKAPVKPAPVKPAPSAPRAKVERKAEREAPPVPVEPSGVPHEAIPIDTTADRIVRHLELHGPTTSKGLERAIGISSVSAYAGRRRGEIEHTRGPFQVQSWWRLPGQAWPWDAESAAPSHEPSRCPLDAPAAAPGASTADSEAEPQRPGEAPSGPLDAPAAAPGASTADSEAEPQRPGEARSGRLDAPDGCTFGSVGFSRVVCGRIGNGRGGWTMCLRSPGHPGSHVGAGATPIDEQARPIGEPLTQTVGLGGWFDGPLIRSFESPCADLEIVACGYTVRRGAAVHVCARPLGHAGDHLAAAVRFGSVGDARPVSPAEALDLVRS